MTLWEELKTLFWLQWKLTVAQFRSRRARDRWQILNLILALLMLFFVFPIFLGMGVALAAGMIFLSPRAAFELAVVANVGILFFWLLLPASSNSQLVERFEMSRLFAYPISYRGIVVGSTLISLVSMTGIWTLPLILGQVIGFAWHAPLALPLILLGALPVFALLVLSGRIVEDLFDLVASDRRLRAAMLTLLTLPAILLWIGQYYLQFVTQEFQELPAFLDIPLVHRLLEAQGPSEFLEILAPSRVLLWLPPGWVTGGMGLVAAGELGRGLLFLLLSLGFVGALLWLHARVTRRLMEGAALTLGAERVRSRRFAVGLPGPATFWALFSKDWLHLRRNPMPRRLLLATIFMTIALLLSLLRIPDEGLEAPEILLASLAFITVLFLLVMTAQVVNTGLGANYFGIVDREGFGTLALSGVDRRYVILSADLTTLLFGLALYAVPLLVVTIRTQRWHIIPLGFFTALCMQVGGAPAYRLASIIGPYRANLKFSTGTRRSGNLWGIVAWLIATPPVIALIAVPYVFWRPGLWITLPLVALYSVGLYLLTLKPLARMLERREYRILEAVTSD